MASWEFALTQSRAVIHYAKLALWPSPLIFDYGSDFVLHALSVAPLVALHGLLIAATAIAVRRRSPLGFIGGCFYLILAPSSSVVGGTRQMVAEHRFYLPLAAVIVLTLATVYSTLGRRGAYVCLLTVPLLGGLAFV
jgi:hypothetical protein